MWKEFYTPLQEEYDYYISLDINRYGGQAVLVKKTLAKPTVCYNTVGFSGHPSGGRFIKLTFPDIIVISIYALFDGTGQPGHLERRAEWDTSLFNELSLSTQGKSESL